MKKRAKPIAYVVLIALAIWLGYGFVSRLNRAEAQQERAAQNTETVEARPQASAKWFGYLAGLLVVTLALGILAAYDISHLFAEKVHKFIFEEGDEVEKDPEYDEAERVWANGNHLEAIQLMRDFLKTNPHAQYAAIRIAEIYEKDLGNYLAAALEYEEILKKKLPPDRWGWAAIHLANIYSGKLNKPEKAEELLRRIVTEHPYTPAARKARERLGEPEPLVTPVATAETTPQAQTSESAAPPSNLPPGFRPKS